MIWKSRSGVGPRHVHDVDQHAGPLDVAQERVAQAGARAGALDEARQVRERDPAVVGRVAHLQVEHAQVGLEGRERVVGDLAAWPR